MKVNVLGIVKFPDLERVVKIELNNKKYYAVVSGNFYDLYTFHLQSKPKKEKVGFFYEFKEPIIVKAVIRILGGFEKITNNSNLSLKHNYTENVIFKCKIVKLICPSNSSKEYIILNTLDNFYEANVGFKAILQISIEKETRKLFKKIKKGSIVIGRGNLILDVDEIIKNNNGKNV